MAKPGLGVLPLITNLGFSNSKRYLYNTLKINESIKSFVCIHIQLHCPIASVTFEVMHEFCLET